MIRGVHKLWNPEGCGHCGVIAMHAQRYKAFRKVFSGKGIALDLGAHVGYWSFLLAADFQQVWAFEANAANYECLRMNAKESPYDNIHVMHTAIGPVDGYYTMRYNLTSNPQNSGCWHVLPADRGTDRMRALDGIDFGGRVDLIKMDVEGYEDQVILGARKLLDRDQPAVIIEVNKEAEDNYGHAREGAGHELRKLGYHERARMGSDQLYLHPESGHWVEEGV